MPPSTIPDLVHALLREHPRVHRLLLQGAITWLRQAERLHDVATRATWTRTGLELALDELDHRWLCHADGPCPDGCDAAPDPERLREYRREWKRPAWMQELTVPWTDDDEAHVLRLREQLVRGVKLRLRAGGRVR